MKLSEHIKALLEKRNGLAQETNTEGDSILTVRAELDKAHKSDCPCKKETGRAEDCTDESFKNGMATLQERITAQKTKREEIVQLDELIEAGMEVKDRIIDEDVEELSPVTGIGMQKSAESLFPKRKGSLLNNIGVDFYGFLHQVGLTTVEDVKSRMGMGVPDTLADGSRFATAASFYATFGTSKAELVASTKSVSGDRGLGKEFEEKLQTRRSNTKSMFTQVPDMSGGDGSLYAPSEIFPGNTGGLCEYMIDNTLDVLPYAPASFLQAIPVRTIPKSYILFARQTLRVNNASAVGESVLLAGSDNPTDAPVDFRPIKPESEFGFSQAKAITLTFADTLPVSEEFLEDCPAVADAVETQLMENVRQAFYNQIINGDGSTGEYPELIGLLAQVGLSTRVHQGAASFMGNTMGAGSADDNIRETLVRAIFDAEAYGYNVDYILMNYDDFTNMYFLKDDIGRPLYNDAELERINGARVLKDVRMPPGVALVGAFAQVTQLLIRRQIRLDIGWIDKQFVQDMLTLRATMRGGILVRAPHALIRVTGL
jgi:hypothetical protein